MADHKYQMPDGSYPIDRCTGKNSVESAAKLAHNSDTYSFEEVKAHVMKAKAGLGCSDDVLPDSWKQGQNSAPAVAGLERRYLPMTGVQIETRGGAPTEIRGYFSVFNSVADIGFWKEVVLPGAFARTIQENNTDIAALVDHDPARVLARISNQRLDLREDDKGGHMVARPTDTSYARDLMTNIAERNVTKQSFGFHVVTDQWRTVDGVEQRELVDCELYDVSPVTYPAYQATSVTVRSQAQEAGLDVQGLSHAFVRHVRGLDLTAGDRDIITQALQKLPILQRGAEGQALPGSEAKSTPSQAWRVSLLRRRFRLAAKATSTRSTFVIRAADPDDDAGALAQAVDQALDEAQSEHRAGNDDQAWQLITAAETTVDQLLEVLNVPDSDEASAA